MGPWELFIKLKCTWWPSPWMYFLSISQDRSDSHCPRILSAPISWIRAITEPPVEQTSLPMKQHDLLTTLQQMNSHVGAWSHSTSIWQNKNLSLAHLVPKPVLFKTVLSSFIYMMWHMEGNVLPSNVSHPQQALCPVPEEAFRTIVIKTSHQST